MAMKVVSILFCFVGYIYQTHVIGVEAGYVSVITTLGNTYLVSDFQATSFSDASSQCVNQGTAMASFDNARLQDFTDILAVNSATYINYNIRVPVTEARSKYYFTDGEEIGSDKWFPGEPNQSCSTCCYRLKYSSTSSPPQHKLADHPCSRDYYFVCVDNSVAATTTTTAETTSTPLDTTTTTPEITSTTLETTSTAETTSTYAVTVETTSSTIDTTSTIPEITSTTLETTSTDETTSTSASAETTTTVETTSTTPIPSPGPIVPMTTPYIVPLSTGQQMSIMYIGLIVGGSLAISCCCSATWLAVNRTRRSCGRQASDHDNMVKDPEKGDVSSCSSTDDED